MSAQPEPPRDDGHKSQTITTESVLVEIDGPVDLTRRPRRASIPYTPPSDASSTAKEDESVLVEIDGPVDLTRRPRRASIPYTPPSDVQAPPKADDKPANP